MSVSQGPFTLQWKDKGENVSKHNIQNFWILFKGTRISYYAIG